MWRQSILMLAVISLSSAEDSCPAPPGDVVTPCALNDTACIGQHLANHSDCSADAWQQLPESATILDLDYESPFFNCSFTDQYLRVGNLPQCNVSQYFTNTTSGRTVLSFTCNNFSIEANRKAIYHQPQQQDTVYRFYITALYSTITFTANLPNSDNLNICRVKAYAYAVDPPITVEALDEATESFVSEDPLGLFEAHRAIWAMEMYNYRATPLFQMLVNNLLCEYRCSTCACD